MDKPSDDVRASFEKWAKSVFCGYDFMFFDDCSASCGVGYSDNEIDSAWIGYQAGIASKQDWWISVKDRLPACGAPVALLNINKFENCGFDRNIQDAGYLAGPDHVPPSANNWWSVRAQ